MSWLSEAAALLRAKVELDELAQAHKFCGRCGKPLAVRVYDDGYDRRTGQKRTRGVRPVSRRP